MRRPFSFQQLWDSAVAGFAYLPQTLAIAAAAYLICLVIGFAVAVARIWGPRAVGGVLQVALSIVKAVPVYLIFLLSALVATLYGPSLFAALHIHADASAIDMRVVAVLALALAFTPAASEGFRGGLLAVPVGQIEAARSVGLSGTQTMWRIIVPQMLPEAIPVLTNCLLSLTKAASLAILIGAMDVLNAAVNAASDSYDYLEAYIAAAVMYWAICVVLEFSMFRLARKAGRFKARA